MSNIRDTVENFIYPFIERFTDMVYRGGEDSVFHGIRVLDDSHKFTHGALVNAAAALYVHYVKTNDERAEAVLDRLHYFIKIASGDICKTWGKLGILKGFNLLHNADLFDRINPQYIDLVKSKTEYEDFFDKKTHELKMYATNYYQVAMACAGYREKFGWENDGFSGIIKNKLVNILSHGAENGWLDDDPPYGRFDRYSIVLSSEYADTASGACLELPAFVRENLRQAAEHILFMANEKGDGISYGRSVTIHGDCTVADVLSAAAAHNLISEDKKKLAAAYSLKVIEKILDFWYNSEKESFDMWWNSRSVNAYRPIDRILEVNLDIALHLHTILENFEKASLVDTDCGIMLPSPENWETDEIEFVNRKGDVKKAVMLRRKDTLVLLPFVGNGKTYMRHNAYLPIPTMCRVIEGSPEGKQPYMIPEYTHADGSKYRPAHYFENVTVKNPDGKAIVHADGFMMSVDGTEPQKSDYRFSIDFEFAGDTICAKFSSDGSFTAAEMYIGSVDGKAKLEAQGFDSVNSVDTTGDDDFCTPHGALVNVRLCKKEAPSCLGYCIEL